MNDRKIEEKISDGKTYHLVKRLYEEVYKAYSVYENIKDLKISDPIKTTDYSSDLGLRLGFDKEVAKDATVKAIAYYGIAVVDRKLPENFDEISLLTKATQIDGYGNKLVDFSPIIFHSVDGNHYYLTPDVGRETWMLVKHLKLIENSGFDILKYPEMFEGLNGKIIANAKCEGVVSLPDNVANELKSEFGDKIIIGPGNGFGLYLCKDGLLKDGIKEIYGFNGGSYKKENGNWELTPNFKFYFVKTKEKVDHNI